MTYGAETWNIKKVQEKKLDVAEMKMLRWACGHVVIPGWTKIENREIWEKMKTTEVHRKIQKKRLRWYGHILRREKDHVARRVLDMIVEGGRRPRRPRRRWFDCVKEDLAEKQLRVQDVLGRQRWRTMIKNGNPT